MSGATAKKVEGGYGLSLEWQAHSRLARIPSVVSTIEGLE